ncbi:tyrosine-protein phosphatase [Alkalicoccus luteus]|uniref:Tyrosine-protein phosphatase n=1 Tax=Alkalicoccus luteus TaxID=1237094 RepID=A0A969PTV2_9BACI|nr:CpsB/CapC family capsule biosynthesis tyrosine phosphatase [Alkalicoccus luteus]NJP37444.1 tyrosine protein phosphatase [Alkalicoccus luteus]
MIDIHSHILPGMDDGAAHEADTLAMAKAAVDEGIKTIVATPHHQNGTYTNEAPIVEGAVDQTNALLHHHGIPLTVIAGQEVRVYGELLEDLKAGHLLTLHGSAYMLVEFPSNYIPRFASSLFYDLQLEGVTPIIAHPERNKVFMEKPSLLYRYIQNGALSQVTAASVTGHFGKKLQKFSLELIDHNLAHFIASDAHNTTSRGFYMDKAYNVIEQKLGRAKEMQDHAEKLIHNQPVIGDAPNEIQAKGLLHKLFNR